MLHLFILLTCFQAFLPDVPVLCYHNVHKGKPAAPSAMHISEHQLDAQLKTLFDSGYHTISPDQLYNYLTHGKPLPAKTFMLTFDDSRKTHRTIVAPLLEKYGFKGMFFVMTVTIGKTGYLSSADIKYLHDQGNTIGAHTWDHPHLLKTGQIDVKTQIITPKAVLEKITGAPVTAFAYPFGEWNCWIIERLRESGYLLAFRLSDKMASRERTFTVRRFMVNSTWNGIQLIAAMKRC